MRENPPGENMRSAYFFRRRIDALEQIPVDGERIQVLLSARDYREKALEVIRAAKKRIYIVALYLQDDEGGRAILEALYAAKAENPEMDIKVFVDFHRAQRALIGHGSHEGNVAMYRELRAKYPHPIDILGVPVKGKELFGVLHLKGSVFDDRLLYTGASFNDVYLHQGDRYRYDRYYVLDSAPVAGAMVDFIRGHFLDNPAVRALDVPDIETVRELKRSIRRFKGKLRRATYDYPGGKTGPGQVGISLLTGFGLRRNRLNRTIHDLMRSASRRVVLLTPYFNPPATVIRDIRALVRRGVKVLLVTGDKTANDFYIPPEEPFSKIGALPYLYENNLRRFVKRHRKMIAGGGLEVHLWHHGDNTFHLKGVFCDDTHQLITGSNLNPRAWRLDLENGLLIHDREGVMRETVEKELEMILGNTRKISSHEELEDIPDYPDDVRIFLSRLRRAKADILVKKLL